MKTLVASLLIAMSTASFADPATNPTAPASFQSSVYVSASHDIRVAVDKEKSHTVQVKILNEEGRVMANTSVGKKTSQYRASFNVNELPDGHYQLVITDGTAVETHAIDLTTKTPTTASRAILIQ